MTEPKQEKYFLESIQKGNKKVFDAFFLKYYPVLCGYAEQFVDADESEEIVQDVMVWLWENRKTLSIESTLTKYLFRAIRNKSMNVIYKNRLKEKVHRSITTDPSVFMEDPDFYIIEELRQKIEEAIAELPEDYRNAFMLNRFEGKTYQEIATLTRVSNKTIDYRIQQALKILRSKLKPYLSLLLL